MGLNSCIRRVGRTHTTLTAAAEQEDLTWGSVLFRVSCTRRSFVSGKEPYRARLPPLDRFRRFSSEREVGESSRVAWMFAFCAQYEYYSSSRSITECIAAVCVFFTLNRSFYPSTSITSVRADSLVLEEIQVMWSQSYATEILHSPRMQ